MCHSGAINNKINNLHYRALRTVYNDDISSFEHLLQKDGSVTIHNQNVRSLAVEMFKLVNDLTPPFMTNIFTKMQTYLLIMYHPTLGQDQCSIIIITPKQEITV